MGTAARLDKIRSSAEEAWRGIDAHIRFKRLNSVGWQRVERVFFSVAEKEGSVMPLD